MSGSVSGTSRVAITGLGLVTPFGIGVEATWSALMRNASALRPLLVSPHWPAPLWPENTVGGPLPPAEDLAAALQDSEAASRQDRVILAGRVAAREALSAANLLRGTGRFSRLTVLGNRVGIAFGTSKGGLDTTTQHWLTSQDRSPASRFSWEQAWPHATASAIGAEYQIRGPASCPVAACATGLAACFVGRHWIEGGLCDVVLVGSSDASLHPAILGSFRRLGVLSSGTGGLPPGCRPFDRNRDGFLIGEGAACLVLERAEHAQSRASTPLAWLRGGLQLTDTAGLLQPDPAGEALEHLIRRTLATAGVHPGDIGYVNLHGTGTLANDALEGAVIDRVFGPENANQPLRMSSLKGALGHLLGAAGSVELALTVLALFRQTAPPTTCLIHPDAGSPARHILGSPTALDTRHALKLSSGFGGHLLAALLEQA